jgi:gliding motility-associated-like protein
MTSRFKILFLFIFLISVCNNSFAQDLSNRGKEFWLAYGFDYTFFNEAPVNSQEFAIYISTEQAATVTVSITNTGYTQTLNIPANTVNASILIPKSGANDARTLTDGLQNRNIHVSSDVPVAVYAHVYATQVSGATMLMPVETYGYSYYSINYYQTTSQSSVNDWYSWFYVIASEDNTTVEITPSDTTKNGWLPGQSYIVNLNKGQSYHVFGKAIFNNDPAFASKDMTGSKILSKPGADGNCHPVAVFSGSGGIRLCRGDGGEFMHQQVFPSQAWGTRYLTYHTVNNGNTDIHETFRNYYRICVLDPTTVVKKNGVVMTGLIKNFFYEHMDSTGGDYFTADKPIQVAQYTPNKNQCWNFPTTNPSPPSYGDPEMFYISPIEQGQKSVLFYTSRKSSIDYVYANIHLPTSAINSLKVDGASIPASQIVTHPTNPYYSVALARFIGAAAQHTIVCDSTFTSTVYGLGNFESYGYNVGTLINNLNSYSTIQNTLNTTNTVDTFSCPNSPFRVFVKLGYPATSITWKLSQATGISPNTDSVITNPILIRTESINGRTYYVYGLQQDFSFANAGTYYIPVTYTATVIENCSHSENASVKVVVKPGPAVGFTYMTSHCIPDSVYFAAAATPGFTITQYLWNFDDNTTANSFYTVKKFNTAGIQNVRLRKFTDNGCVADTTGQITINPSPISKFGVTAMSCAKDSVYITDTSSIASGSIGSWKYTFGDGNTLIRTTGTPFSYTYNSPGTYTIKLVTRSNSSCLGDTASRTVTVNARPLANFSYDKNICVGDSIRFSDNSSIAIGSIVNWKWDFGDGKSAVRSNNNPFYHPYTTVGNYVVKLVTVSNTGCTSDTFKVTVSVNNKPVASFAMSGIACVDSMYNFTSSISPGTGNPPVWYWSFGDGQTFSSSTTNLASHAYTTARSNLVVKHVVSYGAGCTSDTVINTIPIININPIASFNIIGDTLCENKTINFIGSATPSNATWNWQIGSFNTTATPPLSYAFANAGNYAVRVKVTANGCSSPTYTKNLVINKTPVIDAGPDKILLTGASTTIDAVIANPANYNFTWSPSLFLSSSTVLNPIATPPANIMYSIKAMDKISFCSGTDSMKIEVINKLTVPNAFSPNGDNINDKWEIQGLELYPGASVSIFTRGGQKIFETKNYKNSPWDGSLNGKPAPVGAYYYIIKLNNNDNMAGSLLLIR